MSKIYGFLTVAYGLAVFFVPSASIHILLIGILYYVFRIAEKIHKEDEN